MSKQEGKFPWGQGFVTYSLDIEKKVLGIFLCVPGTFEVREIFQFFVARKIIPDTWSIRGDAERTIKLEDGKGVGFVLAEALSEQVT